MLVLLNSYPEVRLHLLLPEPPTLQAVCDEMLPAMLRRSDLAGGLGFWVATQKMAGEAVGWFHLYRVLSLPSTVSVGYRLFPQWWNQGLATEGTVALLGHAFGLPDVARVVATALPANQASIRVMQKAGLTYSRTYTHTTGEPLAEYAIGRSEWLRSQEQPG